MMVMVMAVCLYTVVSGAVKKENLVFVNFSAQDASILKISVSIIKRRSYFFMVLSQFMANKKVLGVFWNP